MAYQLVISGNRILAHGEADCFLSMGGTVICEGTGKAYQNATVVTHEGGLPSDIDTVGYEYRGGVFVPCAPYGKGSGNILVACEDCGTPKDSGIPSTNLDKLINNGLMLTGSVADMPDTSGVWFASTFGNNRFVAVAFSAADVAYSGNGLTWNKASLPATGYWVGIAYGNGLYVAISQAGQVAYSSDCINWTAATLPNTSVTWGNIAFGNGVFVAIAPASPSVIAYSTDGANWTVATGTSNLKLGGCIAFVNGRFMVSTLGYMGTSTDGASWTVNTCAKTFSALSYVGTKYIGFENGGGLYYSSNGASWTAVSDFNVTSNALFATSLSEAVAVVWGSKQALYTSDGVNWSVSNLPSINEWQAVTFGNGRFVAIAPHACAISKDGGKTYATEDYSLTTADGTDMTAAVKRILGL